MSNVIVNGVEYVPVQKPTKRVIVRAVQGVHYGTIKKRDGSELVLTDARRIWYWDGAASLSQMAVDGVSAPENCKFSVRVPEITVLNVCEIIPCSGKAVESIEAVKEWKR
jgi:hypothetical protein